MKSFLKTMLVAGAMTVSLAAMQGEAAADTQLSSWYGPGFEGAPTASGELYNYGDYTAASLQYPLGTELLVSYGGNSTVVVVNDYGPYVAGREIDLSQSAAEAIGLTYAGTDYVDVQVIG